MHEISFKYGDKVRILGDDAIYEVLSAGLRWVGTNRHGSSMRREFRVSLLNARGTLYKPEDLKHVNVVDQLADLTDE